MNECYGKKFILNGDLVSSEMFNNSLVYEGESIYEVIRLVKRSPAFFMDHMDRLTTTLKFQSKKPLADESEVRSAILNLISANKIREANLKIVFNYNSGSENFLIYFIEPIYPSARQYKTGVKGILFPAERKNPGSKVINHKLRSSIYHRLILEGAYEALLVNNNNQITEGSRSNIFFIKGDSLVTAPENIILNGITRKHILEICFQNQIEVVLDCVNVSDITLFDAVFMTGTSPMVLPFCCIGDNFFNVKLPIMEMLLKSYKMRVEESRKSF